MTNERKSKARELKRLAREVGALGAELRLAERKERARIEAVDPTFALSARNLVRYLALRRHDRRALQRSLAQLGLSSLGRAEEWVAATVELVARALHGLAAHPKAVRGGELPAPDMDLGADLLERNTRALLGEPPAKREVRIMVTMPSEAADDYSLVRDLLAGGMDVMRINCAHDDEPRWKKMIGHLRRAEKALGRRSQVLMDLAGPKLRTGPVEPGPARIAGAPAARRVRRVSRRRASGSRRRKTRASSAASGRRRAAVWRRAGSRRSSRATGSMFEDARGTHRKWKLVDSSDEGAWVGGDEDRLPGSGHRANARAQGPDAQREDRRRAGQGRIDPALRRRPHRAHPVAAAGNPGQARPPRQGTAPCDHWLHSAQRVPRRARRRAHLLRRRQDRRGDRKGRPRPPAGARNARAPRRRGAARRQGYQPAGYGAAHARAVGQGPARPGVHRLARRHGRAVVRRHRCRRALAAHRAREPRPPAAGDHAQGRDAARLRERCPRCCSRRCARAPAA